MTGSGLTPSRDGRSWLDAEGGFGGEDNDGDEAGASVAREFCAAAVRPLEETISSRRKDSRCQ